MEGGAARWFWSWSWKHRFQPISWCKFLSAVYTEFHPELAAILLTEEEEEARKAFKPDAKANRANPERKEIATKQEPKRYVQVVENASHSLAAKEEKAETEKPEPEFAREKMKLQLPEIKDKKAVAVAKQEGEAESQESTIVLETFGEKKELSIGFIGLILEATAIQTKMAQEEETRKEEEKPVPDEEGSAAENQEKEFATTGGSSTQETKAIQSKMELRMEAIGTESKELETTQAEVEWLPLGGQSCEQIVGHECMEMAWWTPPAEVVDPPPLPKPPDQSLEKVEDIVHRNHEGRRLLHPPPPSTMALIQLPPPDPPDLTVPAKLEGIVRRGHGDREGRLRLVLGDARKVGRELGGNAVSHQWRLLFLFRRLNRRILGHWGGWRDACVAERKRGGGYNIGGLQDVVTMLGQKLGWFN